MFIKLLLMQRGTVGSCDWRSVACGTREWVSAGSGAFGYLFYWGYAILEWKL